MRSNLFFVYILLCADDSFYTGMTNWLTRRIEEHNSGINDRSYTFSRRPLKLVYSEWHQYVNNAIQREKQIKKWSRAKKMALIRGDFKKLKALSACRNTSHYSNYNYDKGIAVIRQFIPNTYSADNRNAVYLKALRFASAAKDGFRTPELESLILFP